mgnify:CR=1 FL=1|tara:strand:- start:1718 stop:2278 length:561 start_codon:yes stop_codon:yes gene_type:complete
MLNKIAQLFQFLPLSLFSMIAFGQPETSDQSWFLAFEVAALVGFFQLLLMFKLKIIMSRLILSANIYLILGGLASLFQQWWYLAFYNTLQETGIFIVMILVGVITMTWSKNSFVGIDKTSVKEVEERISINKKSSYLFVAVLISLILSLIFKGDITLSAVTPIIFLALFQRYLVHQHNQQISNNTI